MAAEDERAEPLANATSGESEPDPLLVAMWGLLGRAVTSGEGDGPLPLAAAEQPDASPDGVA